MAKLNPTQVRNWAVDAVETDGRHMSRALVAKFGVSRVAAAIALKQLVADGWLESSGGTRPTYQLGRNRIVTRGYRIPGVDEHIVWERDFAPKFDLERNVKGIVHHGFTEMVNNANDHSGGSLVTVLMRLLDGVMTVVVLDNGIGIFEKIATALALPDRRLAILELSKGKFTTDPANHSGEGIFFTSRMFDQFQIEANGLHYDHDVRDKHDWLFEMDRPETGTFVYMGIPVDSKRTSKEIFDAFSGGENYGFEKTVVPVKLARIGNENLVSRSQAKRLVARFDGFKTVVLDFDGIEEIGQSFADEIFRVFANAHPGVGLIATRANPMVQDMIVRAQSHRLIDLGSPLGMVKSMLNPDE